MCINPPGRPYECYCGVWIAVLPTYQRQTLTRNYPATDTAVLMSLVIKRSNRYLLHTVINNIHSSQYENTFLIPFTVTSFKWKQDILGLNILFCHFPLKYKAPLSLNHSQKRRWACSNIAYGVSFCQFLIKKALYIYIILLPALKKDQKYVLCFQGCIYLIKITEKKSYFVKYYWNCKITIFSILIYFKYNYFCAAKSHDPSEIILICWFIIDAGNRWAASFKNNNWDHWCFFLGFYD